MRSSHHGRTNQTYNRPSNILRYTLFIYCVISSAPRMTYDIQMKWNLYRCRYRCWIEFENKEENVQFCLYIHPTYYYKCKYCDMLKLLII